MSTATAAEAFAPITGDPGALRAAAATFTDHADTLSRTSSRLVGASTVAGWSGQAATAHGAMTLDTSGKASRAATACEATAHDLTVAARLLEQAQDRMRSLAVQADATDRDLSAAQGRSAMAAAVLDPAAAATADGDVQHATARLQHLRREAEGLRATCEADLRRCANLIDDSADHLRSITPPAPSAGTVDTDVPWWEQALSAAAAVASLPVLNTVHTWDVLTGVAEHYRDDPGELLDLLAHSSELLGGMTLMLGGGALFLGGVGADITGVGAVVGVPANAAGAAVAVGGAGITAAGGAGLAGDFSTLDRSLKDRQADPGWQGRPGNNDGSTPATPAGGRPYDPKIADDVPPWGTKDPKTRGTLVTGDGTRRVVQDRASGIDPTVEAIARPRPGMNGRLKTHVEAQAAAEMRASGTREATLYINRLPCTGAKGGCEDFLPRMVPKGSKLTVYGPDGYARVVVGEG
ncbi:DddA-like double-stranded DNA deaminase toxin [Kineococcus rhizosphaerae]|uniref:Nucleic acid/nucleotide deaminase of polymorphic system toxin n=1 Tax=Kineococcus rhizosphaerae TaxID=559628 RepID=A0A2T0R887_9ACTN|nr:DddA-like double-stranded DNA deaminase toxin [Kineococcus rhizosphaerae]PRY17350.1 nucleic acid/nucleotide deaminase of polymorphic system toxin [Kineococcus rhizosphaerae]